MYKMFNFNNARCENWRDLIVEAWLKTNKNKFYYFRVKTYFSHLQAIFPTSVLQILPLCFMAPLIYFTLRQLY